MSMFGISRTLFKGLSRGSNITQQCHMSIRAKKKFYKNVDVVHNGGGNFELTLDNRKLKTPLGAIFKVQNETLARAVAHEWTSQKDLILLSQMHLTGLCNVCIDNPTNASKEELVDSLLNFLDTDTVLFFGEENENLLKRQVAEWQPLIDWFCARHGVGIKPSYNMSSVPEFSPEARQTIKDYLMSLNFNSVQGFALGVDAAKSLILMSALVERKITVDEAVKSARLEVDFQTNLWGSVEWAHDLELHDTSARVAAAAMFVHLNSSQHTKKLKNMI